MARLALPFFILSFFLFPSSSFATSEKENDFDSAYSEGEVKEAMSEMLQLLHAERKQEVAILQSRKKDLEIALKDNDTEKIQHFQNEIKNHSVNITLLDDEIAKASKKRGVNRITLASKSSNSEKGVNIPRSNTADSFSSLFDPGSVHHELDTYARSKSNLYPY